MKADRNFGQEILARPKLLPHRVNVERADDLNSERAKLNAAKSERRLKNDKKINRARAKKVCPKNLQHA